RTHQPRLRIDLPAVRTIVSVMRGAASHSANRFLISQSNAVSILRCGNWGHAVVIGVRSCNHTCWRATRAYAAQIASGADSPLHSVPQDAAQFPPTDSHTPDTPAQLLPACFPAPALLTGGGPAAVGLAVFQGLVSV